MLHQYLEANGLPLKSGRIRQTVAGQISSGNPLVFAGYRLLLTEPPRRFSNVQSSSSSSLIVSNLSAVFGTNFFVLLTVFPIGRHTQCVSHPLWKWAWEELVRTLRLDRETDSHDVTSQDGQSSMQWGSMLPMKALFYRPVDR